MNLRRHLIVIVVLGALPLARDGRTAAQGPETKPAQPQLTSQAIGAATARDMGRVFATQGPGWNVADAGFGGAADGNWSYALAGDASWQHYRVSATVALAKPADRQDGMELGCFAFDYTITGSAPKFQIHYYAAGKNYFSQPILDADVWQKLAIVVTPGKIALYVNGRRAEELAANTFPGNPRNHLATTWHRHVSFFGAGSADYGLVPEGPYGCWKGQVRSVKVYRRALTAEEIAAR